MLVVYEAFLTGILKTSSCPFHDLKVGSLALIRCLFLNNNGDKDHFYPVHLSIEGWKPIRLSPSRDVTLAESVISQPASCIFLVYRDCPPNGYSRSSVVAEARERRGKIRARISKCRLSPRSVARSSPTRVPPVLPLPAVQVLVCHPSGFLPDLYQH